MAMAVAWLAPGDALLGNGHTKMGGQVAPDELLSLAQGGVEAGAPEQGLAVLVPAKAHPCPLLDHLLGVLDRHRLVLALIAGHVVLGPLLEPWLDIFPDIGVVAHEALVAVAEMFV